MDTQINFLSLITTALNTYIEQQVNAALAKATPVDEAAIKALIDETVGEKITELFEDRIGEMIDEKMESAIDDAIEQHTRDAMHGDLDSLADSVTESRAFTHAIESAIEEAMGNHTSEYDHDEIANIGERLTEDEIDEKLQDYVGRDEIEDLVSTALTQTTFRLTTAG